eukprot:TRINITY_DN8849_c0_g1_i1.p1 TRINITY_DN8849_c0_g1~~TRINITY_DN8849_c0_g1_i1.p1  ORF type:complete len:541 (+),score=124.39 TRINITY_DN8849_c0_g1_i1:60-1625(+)
MGAVCCAEGPCTLFGNRNGNRRRNHSGARLTSGSLVLSRTGTLLLLPNNTGKLPEDKYENFSQPIGAGAFGTVRTAKVKGASQEVALKSIKKSAIPDLNAFKNEVEINAAMDHPNIIKLYETFEDRQYVCLALEACHGGEIFDKIIEQAASGGGFTERDAAVLMRQILSAVVFMHSNGVCHRDLKPENFLLLEKKVPISKNIVKVIDFGIAKRFKQANGKRVVMKTRAGTAYYVAPEVLGAGSYCEKCDVWSCGVILYILLSGSPPFSGEDDAEILRQAKTGKIYFDLPEFNNVGKEVKDLILQMCKIKVDARPSAQQCFEMGWIQGHTTKQETNLCQTGMVAKLRSFGGVSRFKKAALQVIAHRLDDVNIKRLREIFMTIDANGDGMLSLRELEEGLKKAGLGNSEDTRQLFMSIDQDQSGSIGYTEFLAAMVDQKNFLNDEACWHAFKVFDADDNGCISVEELQQMLQDNPDVSSQVNSSTKGNVSDEALRLFKQADTNGDGQIDFQEFMTMMRSNRSE